MKHELKDWLNSINFTKENLIADDPEMISSYPPYIVNRCLSGHLDTVLFANEMNKYSDEKAKQVLPLLNDDQLNIIRQRLDTGGLK